VAVQIDRNKCGRERLRWVASDVPVQSPTSLRPRTHGNRRAKLILEAQAMYVHARSMVRFGLVACAMCPDGTDSKLEDRRRMQPCWHAWFPLLHTIH